MGCSTETPLGRQGGCPDPSILERLTLGLLAGPEAERLEEHVLHCPDCGAVMDSVRAEDTLVEAVRAGPPAAQEVDEWRVEPLIERLCRLPSTMGATDGDRATVETVKELGAFLDPPQEADEMGRIGPYRVSKVLGTGGMGIVLEATDPELRRTVAVKVMKPALAASESARRRFLREARAAAAIEHDHVVTIYRVGEHRGLPYLAMPRLQGESLAARLGRSGTMPPEEVLRIGRQIAAGLAAAHQRGVVHRDVKPENIWLEGEPDGGRVKIVDFGLARVADDEVRLTRVGTIAGTPAYMAPEQAQSEPVDPRADLFSLGCVLYEMCTGRPAFTGANTPAMLMAVAKHNPPPPHELNAEVPRGLSHVVMKLLEKDRSRRVQSAEELLDAFEQSVRPEAARRGLRRRALVLGLAAAAAAILLAAITIRYVLPGEGTVVLQLAQAGVDITVDGEHVDVVSDGDSAVLVLPSGARELRVSKTGFSTHVELVRVHRGGRTVLEIDLEPKDVISPERVLRADTRAVKDVAFSSDGRLALSGGEDMVLQLWEVETGRLLRRFSGHEGTVRSVAFSPDDAFALSASCDRTARLWSVPDGRELRRFEGHAADLFCAAFSPDGSRVLTGSLDATVRLWDAGSGTLLKTLKGHTTWVRSVAFSPDGRYGLSGGNDALVLAWDLQHGRLDRVLQGHRHAVGQVAFSPDGRLAVSGSWDNTIRLWDVENETELCVIEGNEGDNRRLALVPGSQRLLSAGADGTVHLWDLSEGRRIARLVGQDQIQSIAVAPDGHAALSSAADGTVAVWRLPEPEEPMELRADRFQAPPALAPSRPPLEEDQTAPSMAEIRVFHGHTAGVLCVAFSPDGSLALSGGKDAAVRLWDVASGKPVRQMARHSGAVLSVAFSPDGGLALSTGVDGTVRVWNPATADQLACLEGHESWVSSAVFSPDGSRIVSGSFDGTLRLWDLPAYKELRVLSGPNAWVRALAFLPDGRHVISAGNVGSPIVWDTETGERVRQFGDQMRIFVSSTVAFLPDAFRLAAGDWDGQVHVWDYKSQEKLLRAQAHAGPIHALAFTPDGRYFVTAGRDNLARAWKAADAALACRFEGHTDDVTAVAVSPDSRHLLTGSQDKTLRLWPLPPAD